MDAMACERCGRELRDLDRELAEPYGFPVGMCAACMLDAQGQTWHSMQVVVTGSPVESFRMVVSDLQEELEERTYLRNPRVWWDAEREWIRVDVEHTGPDRGRAWLALSDDLSDSVISVIADFDEFDFELLDEHQRS